MFANAIEQDRTRNNTENLNSRRKFLKCTCHTITHTKCNEILAVIVLQLKYNCSLDFEHDESGNNKKRSLCKVFTYFNKVPIVAESLFWLIILHVHAEVQKWDQSDVY